MGALVFGNMATQVTAMTKKTAPVEHGAVPVDWNLNGLLGQDSSAPADLMNVQTPFKPEADCT